ncbi:2-keto-3-deoxy-galactonokinase [Halarsenatibacter silvermanii]|uniref:2-keto-3-deoxy-galactonokinase n=1 Tax=Halarsenatibacter silvermanii TaxID=321763 RepID=A0A1G9SF79_9FIRM|nr:2-keto-3-deoxy-galactonokinase [Halarsenatibacter silvermanii]
MQDDVNKRDNLYRVYFDVGTSKSRGFLLKGLRVLDQMKKKIGSKDVAIEDDQKLLKREIKKLYRNIKADNSLKDKDIEEIYLSGMVTSKFGFKEVPHIPTPVTIEKLAESIYSYEDEIFGRDINLIRGLKTFSDDREINAENFSEINNVRGEEIEIFGIVSRCSKNKFHVFMPGSHTHIARIENGEIKDLLSSFTGELFQVISEHTLLSPSIDLSCEKYDVEMLKKGFQHSEELGMNRSLYLINTMQMFTDIDKNKKTSYLEGIILGDLIRLFRRRWPDAQDVMVAAKPALGFAYEKLLENYDYNIVEFNCESELSVEGFKMILNYLWQR